MDQILESMLGEFSNIHKISADVTPVFDEYIRIGVSLVYEVEDFKAPDVPTKAVEADTQAIKNSLEEQLKEDEVSIESVKITTSSGELTVKASIAVKFKWKDDARRNFKEVYTPRKEDIMDHDGIKYDL